LCYRGEEIWTVRNNTNEIYWMFIWGSGGFICIKGTSINMIKWVRSFGGMEVLLIRGSELMVKLNQHYTVLERTGMFALSQLALNPSYYTFLYTIYLTLMFRSLYICDSHFKTGCCCGFSFSPIVLLWYPQFNPYFYWYYLT